MLSFRPSEHEITPMRNNELTGVINALLVWFCGLSAFCNLQTDTDRPSLAPQLWMKQLFFLHLMIIIIIMIIRARFEVSML